jgi:hypothetical protein
MKYVGNFTPGKTVRVRFNTHTAAGAPATLSGAPAVSIYKGTTAESTAGVTLTVDYDARTGLNDVVVDTSADGAFYALGSDYDLVVTAGTVDGVSVVGTVVGTFSLGNRAELRPSVADATLVAGNLDAAVSSRLAAAGYTAPPAANAVAAAVLDLPDGIETGFTLTQALRLVLAVLVGKSSGQDTGNPIFRDVHDTKTRVSATTTAAGRTSVATDPS